MGNLSYNLPVKPVYQKSVPYLFDVFLLRGIIKYVAIFPDQTIVSCHVLVLVFQPEANKSPLRFTISDIKSDPAIAFPAVSVESHLYTVRHCK